MIACRQGGLTGYGGRKIVLEGSDRIMRLGEAPDEATGPAEPLR
ncbi:hypothetical protein ABZX98_25630 [Streptomyces sp. NPDC002992]